MTGIDTHSLLLIEDSSDDALLFQTAFARTAIPTHVEIVPSGQAALHYLKGEGRFAQRERFPMPRLVFLDQHLPGMGGLEIHKSLRSKACPSLYLPARPVPGKSLKPIDWVPIPF